MSVDKVLLAAPRGFCAGVEKAIKALDWMTRIFEPPVFCYHEIVHNRFVVDYFKSLGVVFIDDVADVPDGAPVMLSAHGSPPQVIERARQSGGTVIDAVCPLVTKVHHELKVRSRKGYTVLYVGHEGHEEAVGTMAVAPESVHLIESTADIDALTGFRGPFALLSQTTLSLDEWQHLREYAEQKFPDIWMPNRSDLCFATTNRQAALRSIAAQADAVIVIGSANSSNTVALTKVAEAAGCPRVLRVNRASELPDDLEGTVALTAGASAPESLVNEVLEFLDPEYGVDVSSVTVEDEYFPPPPELREVLKTLSAILDLALATPGVSSFDGQADREFTAAQVLSAAGRRARARSRQRLELPREVDPPAGHLAPSGVVAREVALGAAVTSEDLEKSRIARLRALAIDQAMQRFDHDYPDFTPQAIVASICAYEEEGNIGGVLDKMPASVNGDPYTTLVVVDGGSDKTADIARGYPGVVVIEFPVNLGHGVALQVTYRYCIEHHVSFIVTLDADGQNDPAEIPQVLAPLLADRADFVVASRRLGTDETSDRFRKLGVFFFSFIMNRMTGATLTDTSTGYRALRVTMMADVIDRLQQEQYQTAELLITCLKRGWRAAEVPTVWHPRFSGTTKKGKNWLFGFRYAKVVFGTWWRER